MADTKELILDAAERLFGDMGYDATSLRTITSEAGVNIAAVNYHFKCKEELLRSVLARRLRPINEQRVAMLDEYEASCGSTPPAVEELVRILLGPLVALGGDSGQGKAAIKALFGRMYSEPSRNIHRMFFDEMIGTVRRFVAAFQRALPSMPPAELYWRLHFVIGATAHMMAAGTLLEAMSDGVCDPHDSQAAVERLIAFAVGGLKTPLPASVSKLTQE